MSLNLVKGSGNGMVEGSLRDWERLHPLVDDGDGEPMPKYEAPHDNRIQAAVDLVWERLMDCQPLLETVLTMPIDQISKFKAKLYQDLEGWKEENL